MISLNETLMCVKHEVVIEEDESRTKVSSLGTIKARVDANIGSVQVYFHVLDKELVLQSKILVWMRSDGSRVGLIPTLDLMNENQKMMKLKTIVMYSKEEVNAHVRDYVAKDL